ncbi:MAG: hypothetical protein LDL19_00560 [Thiobacillus sp.]|nr:hypothetical protein [Thiobacillus sp.]
MSQLEAIVSWTKKIESTLERQLGAKGRGLHEKTSSVAHRLDASLVKLLRRIATIRNRSMHEDGYQVEDLERFIKDCDTAHRQILAIGNGKGFSVVPAVSAGHIGAFSSVSAFSDSVTGVKGFLLREFAFLISPLMLLTTGKVLLSRLLSVLLVAIFVGVTTATLSAFVLHPAGWTWLWIVLGAGVSALLAFLLFVSAL